jgi:hypothetical protein
MWTDNPVADFLKHDAEQCEALEKLPICADCGNRIHDDFYEICGEPICEDCIRNYKKSIDDYIG